MHVPLTGQGKFAVQTSPWGGTRIGARGWSGSVRLPPDDVNGVIRRDQCVAGHAAPGGQIYGSKPVPGFHLVHTETEFDDELPAADLTRIPAFFQERPFRIDRTPCSGERDTTPSGRSRRRRRPHRRVWRRARIGAGPHNKWAVPTIGLFNQLRSDESRPPDAHLFRRAPLRGRPPSWSMSSWTLPEVMCIMADIRLEVNPFQELSRRLRADSSGTVQVSGSFMTEEM
jgi:hypothetical protein